MGAFALYGVTMMYWIAFMAACGSPEPSDDGVAGSDAPVSSTADTPQLLIEYPERGSFDPRGSGTVRGSVRTDGTSVSGVVINGDFFPVGETGRFDAAMGWTPGIQILGAKAQATNGERAIDGRAFHAGPTHEPAAWIERAIRMEIDGEVLDDTDDEPDDIAGLLELALADTEIIDTLIGEQVITDSAIFTPTRVEFGPSAIDLALASGAIDANVGVTGVEVDVIITGVDWYSGIEINATAVAESVDSALTLAIESDGGVVRAQTIAVDVELTELDLTVDWVPDFLEGSLSGWVSDFIEGAVADLIENELTRFIESSLTAFAVGATLNDDLGMDLRLANLEVAESGIRFEVDARIEPTNSVVLPRNAGSLKTPGSVPEWPESKTQPFWAAIDDDLLNQLGFAFWATGFAKDVEFDGVLIGGLTGAPLPPPLGPADTVVMSLNLPPILGPTVDDDWAARLSIGEWDMVFNRNDGEIVRFSINFHALVNAEVDEGGAVRVAVDNRPSRIDQAIGVVDSPDGVDPGDLAALLELLLPPLLGNSSQFAPEIPIPDLALEEFIDVEATRGKILVVDQPQIKLGDDGWLMLQAGLAVY